jgi:hypothetical protein
MTISLIVDDLNKEKSFLVSEVFIVGQWVLHE